MFSTGAGVVANPNNPPDPPGTVGSSTYTPGDPNQVDTSAFDNIPESRSLPWPTASPWSGWPAEWATPTFNTQLGLNKLIDIAWACIDLNSSVLAAMPVYRMRAGNVIPPTAWMTNPDPDIYTCWQEFAKQLFWDYMLGEAFVLPFATSRTDGYPLRFRVIPPHLVDVEMRSGARQYKLGSMDVTDEILHIRYSSTTTTPRGQGPLEITGARQVAIGLLQRYANHLAETGGTPLSWLELERRITESEGTDLLDRWIESRTKYAGYPALVSGGAKLMQGKAMNAIDMALLELSQFNEARIAIMMGVPPFLVGLPGATGSLTYCLADDTEILTRRGWLTCDDVKLGDIALVLDHETGISRWEPVEAVNIFDVVDEPMLSMHSRAHSSLSTMGHRWPVISRSTGQRRWTDSEHFGQEHNLVLAAPCADLPTEQKYDDDFVELIAWFTTEGHVNTTPNRIWSTIAQSSIQNPGNTASIRRAMTSVFGPARQKGSGHADRSYVRLFGDDPAWVEDHHNKNGIVNFRLNHEATLVLGSVIDGDLFDKVVGHEFLLSLTAGQLHLYIDTCIAGDGSSTSGRGNARVFVQNAGLRVDRFRFACTLAGIATSVYPRKANKKCVTVGVKKRTIYNPTFHNPSPPQRITWTGRVWCPTTASGTWYARRNDREFYTGNSNIESLFSYHDRSSLRPKANAVMFALGNWALPAGQSVELNRDDYTRPTLADRATSYEKLIRSGVLTPDEARAMERLQGDAAASQLTGGLD